jgi:hypothetical protein
VEIILYIKYAIINFKTKLWITEKLIFIDILFINIDKILINKYNIRKNNIKFEPKGLFFIWKGKLMIKAIMIIKDSNFSGEPILGNVSPEKKQKKGYIITNKTILLDI